MTTYANANEINLRTDVDLLMEKWKKNCSCRDNFIEDGFFPFYTLQKKKILFIGREAYSIEDENYIDDMLMRYRNNNIGGNFHNRMRYIAYGLLNNNPSWLGIPEIKDWHKNFATSGEPKDGCISFAFMNFCKINNDTDNTDTQWHVLDTFLKESADFIKQEIELLHPDMIISMNLEGRLTKIDGVSDIIPEIGNDNVAIRTYEFEDGKKIPLYDTWHFSARRKSDIECFYNPICEAISKYTELKL